MSDLAGLLATLSAKRAVQHLNNDPLSFCHRYDDPLDQEVAAVIASSFAYGSVTIILRTLDTIFTRLGSSPRQFVEQFEPQAGLRMFTNFKHRFNDGRDLCALLWAIRQMLEQAGTVQNFFLRGYSEADPDVEASLNNYSAAVLAFDYSALFGMETIPAHSYFPFFFPAPTSGSACKRLCMMLRWLVRGPDGIDLGLWGGVSPAQLLIPVDTHICRISRYLGLTGRKSADWRMAREITAGLKAIDPADPVKFDFALAHLGISDGCNGKDEVVCRTCSISRFCTQNMTK
jgi:uncharacterized protein (TIGR02757 family)